MKSKYHVHKTIKEGLCLIPLILYRSMKQSVLAFIDARGNGWGGHEK